MQKNSWRNALLKILNLWFFKKIKKIILFNFLFFSLLFFFFWEELVLCVFHVLPRTWLFMFLKPSKPIKTEDQNSETKTKTEATNLRLNWSNSYEKKKKKKIKTDQPIKPIWNQNQIKLIKSIWNKNHIKPIKRIYPSPISTTPITTEFPYQTHRRSTHPPPPSSQIKKLKH